MVRIGLWLLAVVFLSSSLLLIFLLLRDRLGSPAGSSWSIAEVLQFTGILLNVVAVVIAVSALQVAVTGYRENKEAIQKQSAEVKASNAALQALATRLNNQQEQVQESPPAQKAEDSTQQEAAPNNVQDGRPFVELLYHGSAISAAAAEVDVRRGMETKLPFIIRNSGNAPARKGTLVVIADPSTIHVDQTGRPEPDGRIPHRFQMALPDLASPPEGGSDFPLDLYLRNVPQEFTLSFSVFGENFEALRRKIPFRIVP